MARADVRTRVAVETTDVVTTGGGVRDVADNPSRSGDDVGRSLDRFPFKGPNRRPFGPALFDNAYRVSSCQGKHRCSPLFT